MASSHAPCTPAPQAQPPPLSCPPTRLPTPRPTPQALQQVRDQATAQAATMREKDKLISELKATLGKVCASGCCRCSQLLLGPASCRLAQLAAVHATAACSAHGSCVPVMIMHPLGGAASGSTKPHAPQNPTLHKILSHLARPFCPLPHRPTGAVRGGGCEQRQQAAGHPTGG